MAVQLSISPHNGNQPKNADFWLRVAATMAGTLGTVWLHHLYGGTKVHISSNGVCVLIWPNGMGWTGSGRKHRADAALAATDWFIWIEGHRASRQFVTDFFFSRVEMSQGVPFCIWVCVMQCPLRRECGELHLDAAVEFSLAGSVGRLSRKFITPGPPLLIGNVVSLTVFRRRKATQRAGNLSVAGSWKFERWEFLTINIWFFCNKFKRKIYFIDHMKKGDYKKKVIYF